jgi:hypothetical protein
MPRIEARAEYTKNDPPRLYGAIQSPAQIAHAKAQSKAALKKNAERPARRAMSSLRMAHGAPAAFQGLVQRGMTAGMSTNLRKADPIGTTRRIKGSR